MARKDDVKMLFDFMIEMLKEDNGVKTEEIKTKNLIAEENQPKIQKIEIFDAMKAKSIMDKIESKNHEQAVVKHALNIQAKDYKKEIEELREAFNQKLLKEDKLEEDKTVISTDLSITGITSS